MEVAIIRGCRRRPGDAHDFGRGLVVGEQFFLFGHAQAELAVGEDAHKFGEGDDADQRHIVAALPGVPDAAGHAARKHQSDSTTFVSSTTRGTRPSFGGTADSVTRGGVARPGHCVGNVGFVDLQFGELGPHRIVALDAHWCEDDLAVDGFDFELLGRADGFRHRPGQRERVLAGEPGKRGLAPE